MIIGIWIHLQFLMALFMINQKAYITPLYKVFLCAVDLILKASGSVLKPRIFRIVILDLEQLDFPQEELHFESN